MNLPIPKEVKIVLEKLQKNNFEGYVVGGSTRNLLLGKEPKDWDIATNAKPQKVQELFPKSFYENKFGTVTVQFENPSIPCLKFIEITTYRIDGEYEDSRRPSNVTFTPSLKEDLARRDLTVNSIAMNIKGHLIDPFDGQKDLKDRIIKTVGEPKKRFEEDALRMLRAIRLAVEIDFNIDNETFDSIKKNSNLLKNIAKERIRDEFIKIIESDNPQIGIYLLEKSDLLKYIIPELLNTINISQNKNHIFSVYEHLLRSLSTAAEKDFSLEVRLAALFHDIGKPQSKEGTGKTATFYNHEIISTNIAKNILKRLKFSNKTTDLTLSLIKNHMFYYEMEKTTDAGIRRMLRRIGAENLNDQINLRICDRLGMGRPKAVPFRLKVLIKRLKEVQKDPISVKMLKINGDTIMKLFDLKPGKKIGLILNALLNKVLNNPELNTKKTLTTEAKKLNALSDKDLLKMSPDIENFEKKRQNDKIYENKLGLK